MTRKCVGSSTIKALGQCQGHVTSSKTQLSNTDCLIWYIVVYITGYKSQYINYIYKQIHIEIFFYKICTAL